MNKRKRWKSGKVNINHYLIFELLKRIANFEDVILKNKVAGVVSVGDLRKGPWMGEPEEIIINKAHKLV